MSTDTVVRARIDEHIKKEAAHVLNEMGLTVSEAIRLLMVRIAREKALPFDVRIPNAETREAMAELESGGGKTYATVADLMADLNEDN